MKRSDIKTLLAGIKEDSDISEIVDKIMEINGTDIESAKAAANETIAQKDAEIAELNKTVKDASEKDAEIKRLKAFESETIANKKKSALKGLFKSHGVIDGAAKRELAHVDLSKFELDDDGKVPAAFEKEYFDGLEKDYPEAFNIQGGTGVPATPPEPQKGGGKFVDEFDDLRKIK